MTNDPDPDELRILVQKVARRIRANRAGEGVSDAQLSVLFYLAKNGDATPGELAANDGVTPPSMNRTLNSLESAELVTRTPDVADARRVRIHLTSGGAALVEETRRLRTAWFTRRLEELSPEERRALTEVTAVLRKLADS